MEPTTPLPFLTGRQVPARGPIQAVTNLTMLPLLLAGEFTTGFGPSRTPKPYPIFTLSRELAPPDGASTPPLSSFTRALAQSLTSPRPASLR
ncbi:hypothetical protein NPIL_71801 [Nephila pilipes]|uniref:Uncharacterized protein n=1 Tax=Nephila pilipes TaxID=299642 RepID=A0A8X6PNZ1_NEPPI|nr:hypothetical protein NPIL_71801 [Nephila pilipes]